MTKTHQWQAIERQTVEGLERQRAFNYFLKGVEAGRDDFFKRLKEADPEAAKRFIEALRR